MQIVVTGAAGFLGRRLLTTLLHRSTVTNSAGLSIPIKRLIAFDMIPVEGLDDPRLSVMTGDIADPAQLADVISPATSAVLHMAAVVSGQAEQDFDLGMRVNVDATRAVLDRIRACGTGAKLVMTSSVAVFGGALPAVVPDDHVWEPRSSYGTQKAMNDLLLADYSRRGWVDGRSLRMPTIVVRPGKPNRAASSFASGIIREPLNGEDAVCPVAPDTRLWLMSPQLAVRNILHGLDLPAKHLGRRVINMPGLSITVGEMLAALRRVGGTAAANRVRLTRDPAIEAIVASWPGDFTAEYATRLGFTADEDFDAVIQAFLHESGTGGLH